jgi:hypothetical protein
LFAFNVLRSEPDNTELPLNKEKDL